MGRSLALLCAAALLGGAGCAGPTSGHGEPEPGPAAPSVDWDEAGKVRPSALPGAPTLSVSPMEGPIPDSVGILVAELVHARLLHRSDLTVVDRRRYTRAVERRQRGLPSPPGAPEAGVSPGVEWIVRPRLLRVHPQDDGVEDERPIEGADPVRRGDPPREGDFVTVALTNAATGEVSATRLAGLRSGGGVLDAARTAGDLLLVLLRDGQLLPPASAGPGPWARAGTVDHAGEATRLFAVGLAAEDRWDWETSGSAYREALRVGGPGFTEAAQALARVARLRSGGTLGQS